MPIGYDRRFPRSGRRTAACVRRKERSMIDADLFRDEGILRIFPTGALSQADFTWLAGLVDPYLETNGELRGLLIVAERFPGWDSFAALVTQIRFVRDHEARIRRVAVVTDSALLELLPALATHFVQAEVRSFPFAAGDEAFAWLKQPA
jgi:hypothetical protein